MAIDTAEKRKSISGIPFLIPGVTPNASKDQEWRQESGWSYSGILAGSGADISTYPPIFTFELQPGLPILTYQVIDLPASRQMISLDSLPLGEALTAGF